MTRRVWIVSAIGGVAMFFYNLAVSPISHFYLFHCVNAHGQVYGC